METLANLPILLFESLQAWEEWLDAHHTQPQGVWLKIAKKGREEVSVSYAEALDGASRQKFFNRRRERDPLGGGFACTWRTRLIKVAAEVITRSRRVIVRLSGSWPHLDHFLQVSRAVSRLPIPPSSP